MQHKVLFFIQIAVAVLAGVAVYILFQAMIGFMPFRELRVLLTWGLALAFIVPLFVLYLRSSRT